MKMQEEEVKEMYVECKLMHTEANKAIKNIDDKIEMLNTQREYHKGLRDAVYTILNMIKKTKKEEEG